MGPTVALLWRLHGKRHDYLYGFEVAGGKGGGVAGGKVCRVLLGVSLTDSIALFELCLFRGSIAWLSCAVFDRAASLGCLFHSSDALLRWAVSVPQF